MDDIKFTQEEQEDLMALVGSDYWKLLKKLVSRAVNTKAQALLEYRGDNPTTDAQVLLMRSAQLDGARSVAAMLDDLERQKIKKDRKK